MIKRNTDKERILVVTTDGKDMYHQLSIIQMADGSFCCNVGRKPDKRDVHMTYHSSGQVNWHIWGDKQTFKLEEPTKLNRVFNFPGSIAHVGLLSQKESYESLQKFNPTKVVYIDLRRYRKKSINIHAFLLAPSNLDYIKLPFVMGSKVSQFQIIADTNPWIGIMVIETKVTAEGPPWINKTDRKSMEWINKLFLDKYDGEPDKEK